jgi:hypothetical protein
MTPTARKKLQTRMKRAFRKATQARKRHTRAMTAYKKLQRKYRTAA